MRGKTRTGTPMGHITENVSRIAHDLVAAMSFDVTDEPYTTHAAAQEDGRGNGSNGSARDADAMSRDLTYEGVY